MIYIKKYITYILCVVISIVIFASGILNKLEINLSDVFFQYETPLDGNIAIVEIDEKSLEELGPFQSWPRTYMADAISILNSDKNVKPAAIGVDIMYFGNTTQEADNALVEACKKIDNVVMGNLINFGSALVTDSEGNFYMNNSHIEKFEEPYEELNKVVTTGHLNTKIDDDGIVRKSINYIELPNKNKINSFAFEVYKKFAENTGREINYNVLTDENSELYIPYSGKPGGYSDGFSFVDILNGEINPDIFEDKIVLIGPYAVGLMDNYITAIDHNEQMYGVEIHANIIDTLIKENFKTYVPKWVQSILVGIIVFLVLNIFEKASIKKSSVLLVVFISGYWIYTCLLYHIAGKISDVLCIPIFIGVIYIAFIIKRYLKAILEKRRVENTFKRYVAPQVVDTIIKGGMDNIELGGKKTDIACLFVDIRGFTTMSEELSPEEVVGILNEYLTLTSSCIFKNNGTLDKFIGDATMAIFNAPLSLDDYIFKAVKTAWDIAEGSEELSRKLLDKFGKTISFGIGVNCGAAVVGNIGTQKRMDYTAIGDTVNTAARLESNAKPGQILISESVYNALKGRIEAESIGEIKLKGKSNSIEVFEVKNIFG